MGDKLLKEIEKGSKLAVMKKTYHHTFIFYNGSSTITDLAKRKWILSVPTVTKVH